MAFYGPQPPPGSVVCNEHTVELARQGITRTPTALMSPQEYLTRQRWCEAMFQRGQFAFPIDWDRCSVIPRLDPTTGFPTTFCIGASNNELVFDTFGLLDAVGQFQLQAATLHDIELVLTCNMQRAFAEHCTLSQPTHGPPGA